MIEFHKIWVEQCEAAEGIKEEFGSEKALGYLIGEKLLNFIGASDERLSVHRRIAICTGATRRISKPLSALASVTISFKRPGSFFVSGSIETPMPRLERSKAWARSPFQCSTARAAVKSDLPFLRKEYGAGNYKAVVKYLLRGEKYHIYATPWTKQKLSDVKRAVNHQGEEQIKRAEELAASGQRQDALKILAAVKRAFHPLSPATHALEVAKRIRRQRS